MTTPANRQQVIQRLENAPKKVQEYFRDLPKLIDNFPLDVALAYVFYRVELAHNMALYCGVVKIHNANSELALNAIDASHMTREHFITLFKTVFNKELSAETLGLIRDAESVRDRVMHGKTTNDNLKREAIAKVIQYAAKFNESVYAIARVRPFGNLRGFHGRGKSLSKATTRWILKGMGFLVS